MTESVGYCAHAFRVNDADRWHDRASLGLMANRLARWKIFPMAYYRPSAGLSQLGPPKARAARGEGYVFTEKPPVSNRVTIRKLQYFYGRHSLKRSVSLPKLKFLEDDKS